MRVVLTTRAVLHTNLQEHVKDLKLFKPYITSAILLTGKFDIVISISESRSITKRQSLTSSQVVNKQVCCDDSV